MVMAIKMKCKKPMGEMIWVITSNGYQNGKFPGKTILIPKKETLI